MTHASSDRKIVAVNFAAMFEHGIILLLLGPLVPSFMATFAIGESMAGLLLAAGSVGFVTGLFFAGAVIDRVNVRAALAIGLAVEAAALVLFAIAPAFAVALVAGFALRFGASFIEAGSNVMPTLTAQRRSPHAVMNLVHMFFSVGAFLGPFLIGLYLEATGQWRPIMFLTLIPVGLVLAGTLLLRMPRRQTQHNPAETHPLSHIGSVFRMKHVVFGAFTLFFYVGAEVGVSSWVVHYLQSVVGLPPVFSAAGLSILWIAIMIGRLANSLLANRYSSRSLVTISGIGGALGSVAFLFAGGLFGTYLALAWIGLCFSGVFPNVMAELNNRHPEKTGSATAVMAMGASLGAGAAQLFVGFVAENVSLPAAFVTPVVLQLLLVASFWLALRAA